MEILLFSKANWIIPDANLAILRRHLPAESTRYLAPRRLNFGPRAFGFVISHERKESGDQNTPGLRHADLFLGGPRLPPDVVSARLKFSARGPKKMLLHGKNQVGRALFYWSACQNLGVPYSKSRLRSRHELHQANRAIPPMAIVNIRKQPLFRQKQKPPPSIIVEVPSCVCEFHFIP